MHAHSVRITHGFACLDAEQDLMAEGVILIHIMTVISGCQRDLGFFTDLNQGFVDNLLIGDFIFLHFQKEISLTEDLLIAKSSLYRVFTLTLQN